MNSDQPKRPRLVQAAAAFFFLASTTVVIADTVGIIGTGRVGGALGPRFVELGHTVIYGSRDPASERVRQLVAETGADASATTQKEAAQQADIVVLAVPWRATEAVVTGLGNLDGKIIMDAVNPLVRADDNLLEMGVDTSAGQLVQGWAPGARVVKAFNTVNFLYMKDPAAAGGPITVPLASDDADAKQRVAEIVEAMGFETADVGPLRMSRYTEGMVVLSLTPMFEGRREESWQYYFRKAPR